ncbi:hypothetical protein HK102_009789 [Quaeritorhiza haematococci]|nr:hypothetical protein HK102_009789 [Quaeritorhiza haematococci]
MMSPQGLPKTFKAVQVDRAHGPFTIVHRDIATVLPKRPNEVLVKVEACGICHGDSIVTHGHWPVPYPLTPGHEIVGRVVAVGNEGAVGSGTSVGRFKVGDRVAAGWEGGHCQSCDPCRRGFFICCQKGEINGVFKNGGYAEYVLLKQESLIPVSEDADAAEVAPLVCAGVTVFNSLRNIPTAGPGDLVAVQGIGGLGHLAIQFAKAMGFRVVALSTAMEKREEAMKMGASEFICGKDAKEQAAALKMMGGAKVIMATAPNPEAISPLAAGLGLDGTLMVVAAAGNISVDTGLLIGNRISVRGWKSGSAVDSEDTIRFAGMMGVKCMVERFGMEDVQVAFDQMITAKVKFRAVLVME